MISIIVQYAGAHRTVYGERFGYPEEVVSTMKAVITVVGKDAVGILAKVSGACAASNVNIVEVTQSVLQDMFAMTMLVEIDKVSVGFEDLKAQLEEVGEATGTKIHVMHENIFNSMHKI